MNKQRIARETPTKLALNKEKRRGRVLDFKSGQLIDELSNFSVQISTPTPPQPSQMSPKPHQEAASTIQRRIRQEQQKRDVMMWVGMIFLMGVFLMCLPAQARSPGGEFSALVENNVERKDFGSEKEMKKFIKKEEKSYSQEKKAKNKNDSL